MYCWPRSCSNIKAVKISHKSLLKNTKIFAYICSIIMLKRYLLVFSALALMVTTLEGCLFHKNRCDTCPGIVRYKKVRKNTKGSL